jgi:hypothetical protein
MTLFKIEDDILKLNFSRDEASSYHSDEELIRAVQLALSTKDNFIDAIMDFLSLDDKNSIGVMDKLDKFWEDNLQGLKMVTGDRMGIYIKDDYINKPLFKLDALIEMDNTIEEEAEETQETNRFQEVVNNALAYINSFKKSNSTSNGKN